MIGLIGKPGKESRKSNVPRKASSIQRYKNPILDEYHSQHDEKTEKTSRRNSQKTTVSYHAVPDAKQNRWTTPPGPQYQLKTPLL